MLMNDDAMMMLMMMLGGGGTLEELDVVMRRVFSVCSRRGIKLSPSKLQIGRKIRWGGVIVESVGPVEGNNDVLTSPDEIKVAEFLNIATPTTKKEVQSTLSH